MISMGTKLNWDDLVEGARFGDRGFVSRNVEILFTVFPMGAGSLKPRGDMTGPRKVVR